MCCFYLFFRGRKQNCTVGKKKLGPLSVNNPYLGEHSHGQLWVDVTRLDQLVKGINQGQPNAM